MRLIYIFGLFAVIFFTNCNGQSKTNSDKDCNSLYTQAKNKLNEYYLVNNDSSLYSSLGYTEQALSSCPEFKGRFTDLKITLLMLLHEYEKGYKFVNALNVKEFSKPYKKSLYLKTFKALSLENQGDTLGRDSCFNELEAEIKSYMSKYPSDKDAIADLFFIKVKHINTELVIKEIDLLQKKNKKDAEFFEGLKETIKAMPK
jgi:hypothetical protein